MRAIVPAATTIFALTLFTPRQVSAQWTPQATEVLNYCLLNSNNCSISVNHITGGWRRNYHGTRLNVLASDFKLIPLIAYGEAVAGGRVSPKQTVSRDQWAKFWTGQDGGALNAAWNRFGQPLTVTLDQMVNAMLRESDNATPDFLLDLLGPTAMQDAINRHVPGYVDTPQSIAGLFTSWMGDPASPFSGSVNTLDYSGIESYGYRKEVGGLFSMLHDPAAVQAQRTFVCATLPWQTPPPSCTFGSGITEQVQRPLETGYFPKSNTRTYTDLMTGLLNRNLLHPAVQAVIEPHLEWRLATATGQTFRRYGAKGGSLATGQGYAVLTWTCYAETQQNAPGSNRGTEVVVSIQLKDPVLGSNALQALIPGVTHFADALALDPLFAAIVRTGLADDAPLPDLIARIDTLGPDIPRGTPTHVQVLNIGTAPTQRPTTLSLYLSNTSTLTPGAAANFSATVPPLRPGQSITHTFQITNGKFLITVVDPQNLIG
ncbi:MAG TPA: serine hydrolase, partial [Candidatus Solibacter sp.]|nr:serine hydrolase [Candidatus Solibacter sp.]